MEKKFKNPIITGQQIGLLGGPLYTTYKVLSAIALSKEKNTSAIYWLETNDADFEEINKIHFIDKFNSLNTLIWKKNTHGLSTGEIVVDENLIDILNVFFDNLLQTEHTQSLREVVLSCYKKGEKLKTCSVNLAKSIFNDFNLKLFEPSNHEFRNFSRKILFEEALNTENNKQCNLFVVENGIRKAIFKKDNQFILRDETVVDIEKAILVPNLQTRNLCQDAYFNTDTYIAGPGEMKYISTLKSIYEKYNVKPANIKKRMSLTLLEPKTLRLLKQTELTIDELSNIKKQDLEKYFIKKENNLDFSEMSNSINQSTDHYLTFLENLEINTKNIKKYLKTELKKEIGTKRANLKTNLKNKMEKALNLSDLLFPFGNRQERVFNIFYYMNLFGGIGFIQYLFNNHQFEDKILEINHD